MGALFHRISVQASIFCAVWDVVVVAVFFFFAAFLAASSARLNPSQQVSEWHNRIWTLAGAAGVDSKHCFVIKPLVHWSCELEAHGMVVLQRC